MSEAKPVHSDWEANRRADEAFDAVECYLPVASPVVFRGLCQRSVLLQGLRWAAQHEHDFKIVGLTWWTEEAWDPRPGRNGEFIFRHTMTIYITMGSPSEEPNWGRGPRPSNHHRHWHWIRRRLSRVR
jgi:hypothetical protein